MPPLLKKLLTERKGLASTAERRDTLPENAEAKPEYRPHKTIVLGSSTMRKKIRYNPYRFNIPRSPLITSWIMH
jgi:hypothetical protein